jgi:sulfite exporter TauE/SafE
MLPSHAFAWAGAALPAAGALFPVAVGLGSSVTHCAGMCGPIHFFLASRGKEAGSVWRYHAGRILGYSILGLLAGGLGSALAGGLTGGAFGETIKASAGWLLAALYALFGLQLLGWLPRKLRLETHAGALFPSRLFGRMAAEGRADALLFPAGLLASLLPCPSTHAVLLFAMGLSDPLLGAASMAALGLSTLPVFALIPRKLPAGIPFARHYGHVLGAVFLGLSAWRIYGAAFQGTPACH